MKKILLSSVAFIGLTAGAMAADLPYRHAPAPYVAVPTFTWTGFYVGVNAGYGFTDNDSNSGYFTGVPGSLTVPTSATTTGALTSLPFGGSRDSNSGGFVGGGQIGYNYQFTPGSGFVVGVEADIQYADFGKDNNGSFGFNGTNFATLGGPVTGAVGTGLAAPVPGGPGNVALFSNGQNIANRIEWFGTVRGRIGYAWDRLFIYGTGGFAYTDREDSNNSGFGFANGAAVPATFYVSPAAAVAGAASTGYFLKRNNDNFGYAVGGGLEYAFTPNWTAKIEGLYVDFGGKDKNGYAGSVIGVTNTGAPISAIASSGNSGNDFAVVRAGLNYKFGTW
jgi:outer membrane immunogenic protein